jgi:arylsulfatase A-like enzyme
MEVRLHCLKTRETAARAGIFSGLLGTFRPALLVLSGMLIFFTMASCSLSRADKQDDVILIIVDTLRPDRLGCYGFQLGTSANIDKLAQEGVLFQKTVTCAPVTLPSVSAILTSTYPVFHNVRYNGKFFLNDSSETLAEILKQQGYTTAAFIGGFPLASRFKVNQGFDTFDDDFSTSVKWKERIWIGNKVEGFERTAAEVNERVFPWLEQHQKDKFFLMVHYFDPHWPYEPPAPYDQRFQSPYNGEVAYTDEQIGRLLDKLDSLGLKKKSLIVLTGDHGEGLGAHNELTHGQYIFDTTVLVPLIVYQKGQWSGGKKIGGMVKTLDITPTILDSLGIPKGSDMQGISLLPALKKEPKEEPILLETMMSYYESEDLHDIPVKITGLRTPEWKLVYVVLEKENGKGYVGQLYNIARDPLELFDVISENPQMYDRLLNQLVTLTQKYSPQGPPKNTSFEMDADTKEKLKSLGYLK